MSIPWVRLFNAVLYAVDLARAAAGRANVREEGAVKRESPRGAWWAEREQQRMEFERERMEAERQRAERALKLEGLQKAGDREIGRLHLMAWISAASLLGALLFFGQVITVLFSTVRLSTRLMLVGGWVFLVVALMLAYGGQARVAASVASLSEPPGREHLNPSAGVVGALVPWFLALGLALVGLAAFTI